MQEPSFGIRRLIDYILNTGDPKNEIRLYLLSTPPGYDSKKNYQGERRSEHA